MVFISRLLLLFLFVPALTRAEAPFEPKKAAKPSEGEKSQKKPESAPQESKKNEEKQPSPAKEAPPTAPAGEVVKPAEVSTMLETELKEFETLPEAIKKVIRAALALTRLKLTYRYASHEVAQGGMDCSGAVYRVLLDEKVPGVPRQSDEMCGWVQAKGTFHRTEKVVKIDDAAFQHLQPGDLLFWSRKGGVEPGRKIPVTHVMLFLGHRVKDGEPVIYGSSDGRSYEGQRRCGVSVFDFTLPRAEDPKVEFYGYGAVPGLVLEEVRKAEPPVAKPPQEPAGSAKNEKARPAKAGKKS